MGRMFPIDFLHTLLKGIVEYTLSWVLHLGNLLQHLDPNFRHFFKKLNEVLSHFPTFNAYEPLRHVVVRDITEYIKKDKLNAAVSSDSFNMTDYLGIKETWKLPSVLLQVMFAVLQSKCFPSDLNWCKKMGFKTVIFNMERCVVNAIVSTLDLIAIINLQFSKKILMQ